MRMRYEYRGSIGRLYRVKCSWTELRLPWTQLRRLHANDQDSAGVSEKGCVDMFKANVVALASITKTTLWRTLEVASLLLKIEDYLCMKDRPVFHKK